MSDGERLREARIAAGLKLREASAQADLSPQFWNDVEFGRRTPPDDTYARMCEAVGLESDRPAVEVERLKRQRKAVGDAINALVAHWNTKDKQRVALPPDWHAWMRGVSDHIDKVSDHIDKVIDAYESKLPDVTEQA